MKTKLVNGSRTPEVIAEELKRTCRLVGVYRAPNGLIYHYYANEDLTPKVIEVILQDDRAVAVRQLSKEAIKSIIPDYKETTKTYDFTFGGF